jgi:hypothetical protein
VTDYKYYWGRNRVLLSVPQNIGSLDARFPCLAAENLKYWKGEELNSSWKQEIVISDVNTLLIRAKMVNVGSDIGDGKKSPLFNGVNIHYPIKDVEKMRSTYQKELTYYGTQSWEPTIYKHYEFFTSPTYIYYLIKPGQILKPGDEVATIFC